MVPRLDLVQSRNDSDQDICLQSLDIDGTLHVCSLHLLSCRLLIRVSNLFSFRIVFILVDVFWESRTACQADLDGFDPNYSGHRGSDL